MNAETENRQSETWHHPNEELQQQAERGRQLHEQLENDLVNDRAAANGGKGADSYEATNFDSFVADAEATGGLWRPGGENGPTDPNFEGGLLRGRTQEWQEMLDRMRQEKIDSIDRNMAAVSDQFKLDPASLDAKQQPLAYLNRVAEELVAKGYMKHESGNMAAPDGLFFGSRLVPTSGKLGTEAVELREHAVDLIKDQLRDTMDSRYLGITDQVQLGAALGAEVRDQLARGMIDIHVEQKAGKPAPPPDMLVTWVADPRVAEISRIHSGEFDHWMSVLTPDGRKSFDDYLRGFAKEVGALQGQGKRSRDELFSGADAAGAHEARKRIEELNRIDKAREEEDRLFGAEAADGGYAGNIRVASANEAAWEQAKVKQERADYKEYGIKAIKGETAEQRHQRLLDAVHEAALNGDPRLNEGDPEARAQYQERQKYDRRIAEVEAMMNTAPNHNVRNALKAQIEKMKEERDAGVGQLAEAQRAAAKVAAEKAVNVVLAAQRGERTYDMIDNSEENFSLNARANRDALSLEPVPFRERRAGGRVTEAYFRVPGNDHVVVMERYDRRTGALLSQSTWSTEQPISTRRTRRGLVPPSEVTSQVNATRNLDQGRARQETGARVVGRLRASRVALGGGTGALDGDNGVYSRYGASKAQLANMRRQNEGGGIFSYWLFGTRSGS